jgi:hypothetical protein
MNLTESKWLIPLLQMIRKRPGLFLGGAREATPGVFSGGCYDVATLALYCAAYAAGRNSGEGQPRDSEFEIFANEFADWLVTSGAPSSSSGPPNIRLLGWVALTQREAEARGEVDSLHLFFQLFDQFLRSRSLADTNPQSAR